MLVTQDVISIAQISQYLWADTISSNNQLMGGNIDPFRAQQLYMERKALQYGNSQNLSGLAGATTYVYALCGSQLQLAIQIYGTGQSGGGVIPGGGGNFSVFEYSTNAVAGSFTVYFPDAIGKRCINAFRQGNNIGTILTSGTPTGNQVVWDKTTGALTVASGVAFYSNEFVRVIVQQ
jgi:hypothetical protein